jgi:penicillin amidase
LGNATLATDREKRRHRLRSRMAVHWTLLPAEQQALLAAYTQGANAGLAALPVRPWQYLLLRSEPQPWREIDSMLVVCEMYYILQARDFDVRFNESLLREQVGSALFDWLKPKGGTWDAPLDGSQISAAAMPSAEMLDTRRNPATRPETVTIAVAQSDVAENSPGSNNWALNGVLTANGSALLANDMHLGLSVPNIWFRSQFLIGKGNSARRIAGVTLPGSPAMVIASNGQIAWGFTNSTGKWFDWVAVDKAEKVIESHEIIAVKGSAPVDLVVHETRFGPILRDVTDASGKRQFAIHWSLYDPGAVNARLADMMDAKSVDEGINIAQQSGVPHQNILIADRHGNIGWTIAGRMPRYREWRHQSERGTFTPADALPAEWLAQQDYPQIINPAGARLYSANNRLLGGADGAKIGDGGFDLGARGAQIRDRLMEKSRFDETALHAIQRDNESRFFKRWAKLARDTAAISGKAGMDEIVRQLDGWNGRADIDQTGHRLVRSFRIQVSNVLWKEWIKVAAPSLDIEPAANGVSSYPGWDGRSEYAIWQAITSRADHLLPQPFGNWDQFLDAQLALVQGELIKQNGSLNAATWGKRNGANIRHPIARALPLLSRWLDMPVEPLAGDNNMPLVAAPSFGASERMVVAPGFEERGLLVMPGGQSGHPLSPFYGAGHEDWVHGAALPLLAGETRYRLQLNRRTGLSR